MREVTATEAARKFSNVLDAVEHSDESFLIRRGGRTVALIGPAPAAAGRAFKEVLRSHRRDRAWASELGELRELLRTEERPWPA